MEVKSHIPDAVLCALCSAALVVLGAVRSMPLCIAGGICLMLIEMFVLLRAIRSAGERFREREAHSEQQLSESARALERARAGDRSAMDEYRSTLDHGLRMSIAVIQGSAELLLDGMVADPDAQKEYIRKILLRCETMTNLLSRQDKASEPLKPSYGRVDLIELAKRTADHYSAAAGEKEIRFHVISPLSELPIIADAFLLELVLNNILENAVKYMGRPGNVTVRIQKEGSSALMLIRDDGLGLPEGDAARIFEKGFQGSNRKHGQGLGMYQVRRVILAHGGSIEADSRPGQGLSLRILLPVNRNALAAAIPDE